jgi:hypothetical protein
VVFSLVAAAAILLLVSRRSDRAVVTPASA